MSTVKKSNCLDIELCSTYFKKLLKSFWDSTFCLELEFFHSTFYQEHEFVNSTFCQEHEFFHGSTLTQQNENHVAYFFINHSVNCQNSFDEDELTKLN